MSASSITSRSERRLAMNADSFCAMYCMRPGVGCGTCALACIALRDGLPCTGEPPADGTSAARMRYRRALAKRDDICPSCPEGGMRCDACSLMLSIDELFVRSGLDEPVDYAFLAERNAV